MAGLEFSQRTTERVPQRCFELRVVVFLLYEFIHTQRLADDLVLRQVAAALHFLTDELFLMWRKQNFHGRKVNVDSNRVKKFNHEHTNTRNSIVAKERKIRKELNRR